MKSTSTGITLCHRYEWQCGIYKYYIRYLWKSHPRFGRDDLCYSLVFNLRMRASPARLHLLLNMAGVTNIALNDGFSTMDEAIKAVEDAMAAEFHPVRRETEETVRNFNKKYTKDERKITTLREPTVQPELWYSCYALLLNRKKLKY